MTTEEATLDVRSLLQRKDRGVFHLKEPSDPAQVISESAFYRMNLQKDEQRMKDYTNKLLASKNREAIKAKRSRLTARKE